MSNPTKEIPVFDPNKPFEVVDDTLPVRKGKPKFDPNKPFEVVEEKKNPTPSLYLDGKSPLPESEVQIPTVDLNKNEFEKNEPDNPIDQARYIKQLEDKATEDVMGNKFINPEDEGAKYAQHARGKLKEGGFNSDELISEIGDLNDDDFKRISQQQLLKDREENYPFYIREVSRLKWKGKLDRMLNEKLENGDITPDEYNNLTVGIQSALQHSSVGDYESQRQNINSVAKAIKVYGGDKKDELLKDYAGEVSKIYGNSFNYKFDEAAKNDPNSKFLNNEALLGLHYIQDVDPDKAKQYERLFIDPKTLKDKPDEQRGYNHLMETLEQTGVNLQKNAINEELNSLYKLDKENGGLTPEQLQRGEMLEKKQQELLIKEEELDNKYPNRLRDKIDDATQEILGQKINWFNYAGGRTGAAIKNTIQGVWEAVSSPFMSDESNSMRELAIMGEKLEEENIYHKTDKNKGVLTDKLVIQPELQKKIDVIVNDESLDRDAKEMKLYRLLQDNKEDFGRIPIHNGKFNVSPSSILYGITDIGTTLVPFIALEAATGGGATAGATRKFLSTFTAAAATSFHDEYASALLEGKSQSDAYKHALTSTAISSFAMAGAQTPQAIKEMAGLKTSAGKLINRMTDAEIEAAMKTVPKGLKSFAERLKATPKMAVEGVKTGARFEVAMNAANEVKHQVLGTPIDRENNFKQSVLNILNFGILGAGLGHVGYKKPSELQKSAFIETGKNPTEFTERANQMRKDGQITENEFEQIKANIESSAAAYKNLPTVNAKGQPLSEKEKGDYLYNEAVKNEALKKSLPLRQKEKAEHTALVADFKNDLILEPKTEKQLESRKASLEKSLEPKKDVEGKAIEVDEKTMKESKAEIEAIDTVLEDYSAFTADANAKRLAEKKEDTTVEEPTTIPPEYNDFKQNENESVSLDIAKEIVNSGSIESINGEVLKESIQKGDEEFKKDLKQIADQSYSHKDKEKLAEIFGEELIDIAQKLFPKEKISYIRGFEPTGKEADLKMRSVADAFIGEVKREGSISYQSAKDIASRSNTDVSKTGENVISSNTENPKIVMLARGYEFKDKPLDEATKKMILDAKEKGAKFIAGDMEGVDNQLIQYVKDIGGDITVYGSSNNPKYIEQFKKENISPIEASEQIKEGVDFIFDKSPELKSFGTPDQYSKYIESIFPESKVKDVLFHGTISDNLSKENKQSKFSSYNKEGIYFTPDIEEAKQYAWSANKKSGKESMILPVALDIKNPATVEQAKEILGSFSRVSLNKKEVEKLKQAGFDGIDQRGENKSSYDYVVVFDPLQVHILGSEKDMQGFSKWAQSKTNIPIGETKETTGEGEKVTGIKNEQTLKEREAKGLGEVEVEARRTFGDVFDKGKKMVEEGEINPRVLAESLSKNPRTLKAEESVALIYDRMKLHNEHKKLLESIEKATDEVSETLLRTELQMNEEASLMNDVASRKTGYEQGLGLAVRKMMIKEDYSLANQLVRYRVANEGKELSKETRGKLEDLTKKLNDAQLKIEEYEIKVAELQANKEISKTKRKKTSTDFTKERDSIKSSIKDKLKEAGKSDGNLYASIIPLPAKQIRQLVAITPDVAKLVKSYAEEGVTKLSDIVKNIHDILKPDIEGITEKEVIELIAGVYKEKKSTSPDRRKMELQSNVEKVKRQIDLERKKIELSNRSRLKKGVDYFHKWRRLALLSGVKVLGKIGAAAAMRSGVTSPLESMVGAGLKQLPGLKTIAEGAPREGAGFNPKAEAKALTQWVDKMTYKDIGEVIRTGEGQLDYLYKDKLYPPGGWMDFFGHLHGAIKTLPKRAEFFRSFELRAEHAAKNGKDLADPIVQQEIAAGAYNDSLRAIFMNDNYITDAYKSVIRSLENSKIEGATTAAEVMKFLFPIVKVPTNFVAESTSYMIGGLKAAYALRNGIKGMTPDQKDYVFRAFKKQTLGLAFIAIGYFNPQNFGGYYSGKRDEDDLQATDIELFGVKLPHWMSHTPLLEALHFGATLRRAQDDGKKKGKNTNFFSGIPTAIKGTTGQIPFFSQSDQISTSLSSMEGFKKYLFRTAQGVIEPQLIKEIADLTDNKLKENEKRNPEDFIDYLKMGIPVLREEVPIKNKNKKTRKR